MKLQNLTVIFIIIIIPIILLVSLYITTGLKTLKYQSLYDTGLLTATHDAIFAFEQNTSNDEYSNNPEIKRDILKSSIKMFEKSLANTCGISSYNVEEIEEYIPAIVFGMYDGFYMYAPSKEYISDEKYEYKHNLKNYVYYSETLDDGTVIRYSLDNYVVVTGLFKDENGNDVYQTKGGYLAVGSSNDGKTYQGVTIVEETGLGEHSKDGINYYQEAYEFTNWFNTNIGNKITYLKINEDNDPEDDNSAFVQHKRSIIKSKIEGVLNSSITAYSNRTWDKVYKMPKLSEEDWEKIYSNISMITFFQGKNIGLTKYNGYCVLNSTNSREYVNPNLMYFIDGDYYHDIRCTNLSDQTSGYRIGSFEKRKIDVEIEKKDADGNVITNEDGTVQTEMVGRYKYDITALACYDCINGPLQNNVLLYDYVRNDDVDPDIKSSYFTSLGRERYNGSKPISYIPTHNENESEDEEETYTVTFDLNLAYNNIIDLVDNIKDKPESPITVSKSDNTIWLYEYQPYIEDYEYYIYFNGWSENQYAVEGSFDEFMVTKNTTLYAIWGKEQCDVYFYNNTKGTYGNTIKDTKRVEFNTKIEPIEPLDKSGYTFIGWETFDGQIFDFSIPIRVSSIKLYPRYIRNYNFNIVICEKRNGTFTTLPKYNVKYTSSTDTNVYTNTVYSVVARINIPSGNTEPENTEYIITSVDYNTNQTKGNFKDGETAEGWYKVRVTPVINGVKVDLMTKEQVVVIDRTSPKITYIMLYNNLTDFNTYVKNIRTRVADDGGSGIDTDVNYEIWGNYAVYINYSISNWQMIFNELEYEGVKYNFAIPPGTISDATSGTVYVYDKAGNYTYKQYTFDPSKLKEKQEHGIVKNYE